MFQTQSLQRIASVVRVKKGGLGPRVSAKGVAPGTCFEEKSGLKYDLNMSAASGVYFKSSVGSPSVIHKEFGIRFRRGVASCCVLHSERALTYVVDTEV